MYYTGVTIKVYDENGKLSNEKHIEENTPSESMKKAVEELNNFTGTSAMIRYDSLVHGGFPSVFLYKNNKWEKC